MSSIEFPGPETTRDIRCHSQAAVDNRGRKDRHYVSGFGTLRPLRSFADVPNRIVRLFLQEAGRQYDTNRGYPTFGTMTPQLIARFDGCCAYCGEPPPPKLVEEHLVPINRTSVGLHAWGNIVPACKGCNDIKRDQMWAEHPLLNDARRQRIESYVADYDYDPDVSELRVVLERLYDLSDTQTRALVELGLVASRPYISGLHAPPAEPSV